jgi:Cu2+-exporting ATPase
MITDIISEKQNEVIGGVEKYACPMNCEADKVYDSPGKCPVCKMNLQKVPVDEAKNSSKTSITESVPRYHCPMNCEGDKTYEEPGKCPVCKMNLQKVSADGNPKEGNTKVSDKADKYHCPMHCEGEKEYDEPGNCPVCGMNLVKDPTASTEHTHNKTASVDGAGKYTCPMHPEIIRDAPGSCPICGMDLVAMQPSADEEEKTFKELSKKFKVAVGFTFLILIIAMSDMLPTNPLFSIMSQSKWNFIQLGLSLPVVFYSGWMFFERAWRSIVTWNLNMFTLIGIGTGIAFTFSLVAMFFPQIFPAQFKTENDTVFVYFEASTVILTLVLLGQLLEARAHTKTSGAIKELLKLVPSFAMLVVNGEEKKICLPNALRRREGI